MTSTISSVARRELKKIGRYDLIEAVGKGVPLRPEVQESFGAYFVDNAFPGLFEAMARREIRVDPSVLD